MNGKSKLAILTMFIILVAMIAQSFAYEHWTYDSEEYMVVKGVLDSDYYELYPYAKSSVDIGFSKYGENIAYDERTGIGVGLQYPGYDEVGTWDQTLDTSRDPFANEWIYVWEWMNGWLMDIKYYCVETGGEREIWAFALFSDGLGYGGDWVHCPEIPARPSPPYNPGAPAPLWQEFPPFADPGGLPRGGRKTNGLARTQPIKVLYDGPRRLVALLETTISDVVYYGTPNQKSWDLVRLYITVIFDKVKKTYIMLKDVKRLYIKRPLNIEFGNREQWDLGPGPACKSYVHFYTDDPIKDYWEEMLEYKFCGWEKNETQYTCYGSEWHVDQTILDHGYAVAQVISEDLAYVGAHAVWPHPEFWSVQRSFLAIDPGSTHVPPVPASKIETDMMLAPLSRFLDWMDWTITKDSASLLEPYGKLPDRIPDWITIDDMQGWGGWTEPSIPWVITEHDFWLGKDLTVKGVTLPAYEQYRVVSAYILTDLHDADDLDIKRVPGFGLQNRIDREIQYQLDEIFDPQDIWDAVHKMTKRWVQFFTGDGRTSVFPLDTEREVEVGKLVPTVPVESAGVFTPRGSTWDTYCSDAERVLVDYDDDGVLELLVPWRNIRTLEALPFIVGGTWYSYPYTYEVLPTGEITFLKDRDGSPATKLDVISPSPNYWIVPKDKTIKVLWSSSHMETKAEQWTGDGVTDAFPLHHDIPDGWEEYMEVFLVELPPEEVRPDFSKSVLIKTTEQLDGPGPKTIPAGTAYGLRIPFVETVAVRSDSTYLKKDTDYEVVDFDVWTGIRTKRDIVLGEGKYLYADYEYWSGATIVVPTDWVSKEVEVKYHIPWRVMKSQFFEEKFHRSYVPIDLAFVVDTTYSMGADGTAELPLFQAAVPGILDAAELASGGHMRASLVTFGDKVTVDLDWTIDIDAVEDAILALSASGNNMEPEASDEALNTVVNALFERTNQTGDFSAWSDAKKIIVIVTDARPGGFDDFYEAADLANAKKHADEAAAKGIRIFSIDGVTSWNLPPGQVYPECTEALQYYAAVTGGRYINVTGDLVGAFRHMLDGLLTFTLEYPADTIENAWIHSEKALPPDKWWIECTPACDYLVLAQPVPDDVELKVIFKVPGGRYEWAVVGRDARTIDSMGTAMVAAAFKNKNIEIGLASEDMTESRAYQYFVPNVMRVFGTAPGTRADYRDDGTDPGLRPALKDDWCKTWPIASSDMISIGGPEANVLTEYFNEFTDAYYDWPYGLGLPDTIASLTCWSKNYYKSSETVGYAVIATYKDLNGTVGLVIYGPWGRDTYFACKWFDEHKFELQHINEHVTAIVLKIDYTKHEPLVCIKEFLGTISEKPPHPDA